jgi:hypothetical protein
LPAKAVVRLLAFHLGDSAAAAFDGAEQVGVEYLADVVLCHCFEWPGEAIAGVADEGVDPAILFDGGGDDALAIFGAGNIGDDTKMLAGGGSADFLKLIQPPGGQNEGCAA